MTVDAVVLAGGRAVRLGGRDKPLLRVAGRTLLDRAVAGAQQAGCRRIVVVGPPAVARAGVLVVREDPPFGGPVAALGAALPVTEAEEVIVVAGDLVRADDVVLRLARVRLRGDGACLVDDTGQRQWLASRWRVAALRSALDRLPSPDGAALRDLLAPLDIADIPVTDELVRDIDTPEDLEDIMTTDEDILTAWTAHLATRCGVDPRLVPIDDVLDMAADVAHGVVRPAAPLSAFVAGLVAGRAGGTPQDISDAVAAVVREIDRWPGVSGD